MQPSPSPIRSSIGSAATARPPGADEELLHWLALRMVPGLGARRAVGLIRKFQTPELIFRASRSDLERSGLPGSIAQSISSGCAFEDGADQLERTKSAGASVIAFTDPRYPEILRQIYDPPLLLYVRGDPDLLSRPAIAMVGTRRPSPYGVAAAERLSTELSEAGLVIVSGMARGIDTAAHRTALKAGGLTVAVFGSGIDHIYPAENRRLSAEIAESGCLVSEFPTGSPGHPQNFPVRNRIISGLSLGVLIVEGAQYSGSAITAQLALEQNREVFAVPGNITSKLSWAPNLLIKQGAHLVQSAEDVLTQLPVEARRFASTQSRLVLEEDPIEEMLGPNAPLGRQLLGLLTADQATQLDSILESCASRPASEVIAALFQLELAGAVRQLAGRNFVKVW